MSFWATHKANIYKYGHIYATFYGLVVINYIHQRPSNSLVHRLAVIYSHVVNLLLIVVLPVYFGNNMSALVETTDHGWQLHLVVDFANTLLKYAMVVVTYLANFIHYDAIRTITKTRQQLEDEFALSYNADVRNLGNAGECAADRPRRLFERMLLFKFALINIMMVVQVANIVHQYMCGTHLLLVQIAIYTFVLWNYMENMADYFYFINCSALKFYRQLHVQLQQLFREVRLLHGERRRGIAMQQNCQYCDQLDQLAARYQQIHQMSADSVKMHQIQLLGLVFMTLISNLTNFFTLFNLFQKETPNDVTPQIAIKSIHTLVFYVDTYIVVLISEHIGEVLRDVSHTLKQFNQVTQLDIRLEQAVERFAFLLLNYKVQFHICGLFKLNRHLAFLTAITGLSYFVTLVQFDINLNQMKLLYTIRNTSEIAG